MQTIYQENQCTHMCTVGTTGLIIISYTLVDRHQSIKNNKIIEQR